MPQARSHLLRSRLISTDLPYLPRPLTQQAQNILYTRCADALKPFKYSGYPLLLKVIATVDDAGEAIASLFSDESAKTLVPAAELLQNTIAAAPLNAGELQRIGGLETLVALFRRCLEMLTLTSEADAVPFRVVLPVLKTLAAVASNADCTARLALDENIGVLDDVVRCLHLPQLPKGPEAALEAISALCIHPALQVILPPTHLPVSPRISLLPRP